MNIIPLKYGDETLSFDLSTAQSVTQLTPKERPAITDLSAAFLSAVETQCVDSPPLKDLVSSQDLVTIVISDLTRFWMRQDKIVPLLVDYLHDVLGLGYDQMVILVALGTHRPQTPEELMKLTTEEVYHKVSVVNHDCLAPDLAFVGTTSYGTDVWVNPLAVNRKVILLSGTVHHLMAGFGGGRKSVLPGIAGRNTIRQNHLHALAPELPQSNPEIGVAKTDHNPIHQDMYQATALVNPTFGLNVVVNSQGQHCALVGGHWNTAWKHSCDLVQAAMEVPITQLYDTVVVSCGGYPKDINLYQAVKSLFNARRAVKPGGTLIFLAQCREGGGAAEFFDWIVPLGQGRLDEALRADFTIAGYIFYAACENIAQCGTVHILTDIPDETLAPMGMVSHKTLEALQSAISLEGQEVAIIQNGGSLVPLLVPDGKN